MALTAPPTPKAQWPARWAPEGARLSFSSDQAPKDRAAAPFGATCALDGNQADVPAAASAGWGPDWSGKIPSPCWRLVARKRRPVQAGPSAPSSTRTWPPSPTVARYARARLTCPRAREHLSPTLTVNENGRFFSRACWLGRKPKRRSRQRCLRSAPARALRCPLPAGQLPGG